MATFKFELVSPERLILTVEAEQVDLPGTEGDFGVLSGHAPLLATLKTGVITVKAGASSEAIYVRGGFADVNPDGLTVLAEKAVLKKDFSQAVAAAEMGLVEEQLAAARTDEAKARAVAAFADVKAALAAIA